MAQCPNGHATAADDYCDVCGAPVVAAPPPPPPPAPASDVTCPNCGTPNAHDTLFCENCGYDFTTGAKPRQQAAASLLDLDTPLPTAEPAPEPAPGPATQPQPLVFAATQQQPAVPAAADPAEGEVPVPAPAAAPAPAQPAAQPAADAGDGSLLHAASSRLPRPLDEWSMVAEVWIDPEWYAVQDCDEPMPSPGLPGVVALRTSRALIGRASRSRGIDPEIDCGTDSSVSRRQAELTTDGLRWWVEDLGSANGTFVGAVSAPLPTDPIPKRTEVAEGERIFVGAWTRIVLRRATDEEKAAFAQG